MHRHGDDFTALDAPLPQRASEFLHAKFKLAMGNPFVAMNNRRMVSPAHGVIHQAKGDILDSHNPISLAIKSRCSSLVPSPKV